MEFGKWGTVLGDDKMTATLVNRLVYHGRMVEFTGASHRMENALMLGKQCGCGIYGKGTNDSGDECPCYLGGFGLDD